MEKIVLEGGAPLQGTIRASGAKNAALPILVASLLAPGEHRFSNVPDLADISATLSLLGRIGCPSLNPTSTPSPSCAGRRAAIAKTATPVLILACGRGRCR